MPELAVTVPGETLRDLAVALSGAIGPRAAERFISKVRATSECWYWTAAVTEDGYGRFGLLDVDNPGRWITRTAPRVALAAVSGRHPDEIAEGLVAHHACRNRACVRPVHLEFVTAGEALMRSPLHWSKKNADADKCVNGHPFAPENTYVRGREGGGRTCKQCTLDRKRARRERLRRGA